MPCFVAMLLAVAPARPRILSIARSQDSAFDHTRFHTKIFDSSNILKIFRHRFSFHFKDIHGPVRCGSLIIYSPSHSTRSRRAPPQATSRVEPLPQERIGVLARGWSNIGQIRCYGPHYYKEK